MCDVELKREDSKYLLSAHTDKGREWLRNNVTVLTGEDSTVVNGDRFANPLIGDAVMMGLSVVLDGKQVFLRPELQ